MAAILSRPQCVNIPVKENPVVGISNCSLSAPVSMQLKIKVNHNTRSNKGEKQRDEDI